MRQGMGISLPKQPKEFLMAISFAPPQIIFIAEGVLDFCEARDLQMMVR
jgi:hypothetical protein